MAAAFGQGSVVTPVSSLQQQQYCLKWNSFHTNMSEVFQNMLIHENLVDVTLACEGQSIKTHKMILAACSPYFQTLFTTNPCKHPIVILKDVKFNDLKAIIDFIYSGEVNIPQEQLSSLLKTAETLKIKGLADFGAEKQQVLSSSSSTPNSAISLKNTSGGHLLNTAIPVNYGQVHSAASLYSAFGKKRKRARLQYSLANNSNNSSAINLNHMNNNNNSKSYTNSPQSLKGHHNSNSQGQSTPPPVATVEAERDEEAEEFEPTKLLEQSMLEENTGVDYSPENNNNEGHVQSGDEEEGEENSKNFLMEDEYSSNNSLNNDGVSVLPVNSFANQFVSVASASAGNSNSSLNGGGSSRGGGGGASIEGIREYEQLLQEIQQKNLTICPICSKEFIKKSKLIRHYHTHFSDFRPKFRCVFCGTLFTTQDWCKRHALNCQMSNGKIKNFR